MNPLSPLRCCLAVIVGLCLFGASANANPTEILFEYGVVTYADGGPPYIPHPGPPIVKVYKDGRMVVTRGDTYRSTRLTRKNLRALRAFLSRQPLLRESSVYTGEDGGMAGLHGGFAYLYHNSVGEDVYVVSKSIPDGGVWGRLVARVQAFVPRNASLYYPSAVVLSIDQDGECGSEEVESERVWRLDGRLPLRRTERPIDVTDSHVGRSLFGRMYARKSLYPVLSYCSTGSRYLVYILGVPGWYGDPEQDAIGYSAQEVLRSKAESK